MRGIAGGDPSDTIDTTLAEARRRDRDSRVTAPATGSAPAERAETELSLLRSYEPIACFAKGELFFPTAVGPYVGECSLWRRDPDGERRCVVPAGELSLERLCEEAIAHRDYPLSLRFVEAPLRRAAYWQWRRGHHERLVSAGRLTTTGMFGRLVEAAFRGSLLLRGTVAKGLAAAAEVTYRERLESDRVTYYGRVVRTGGYLCLQYWFFYAMNDWRSTFSGVNDHEADWEMATVYLADRPGEPPEPVWVAFSSHDHTGDDLRRRWDDPELQRRGDHPLLFPGAGSHSGAFVPGDYVVTVDPPQLRKVLAVVRRAQRFLAPWRDQTRPGRGLGIPFIDYARGDGKTVGPGQPEAWTANLIGDETAWVRDYRGLWGLDTEDHFGGERAPAGPRYERDGTTRPAWADPVGWAGLLKVPPGPDEAAELLSESVGALERRLARADEQIAGAQTILRRVAGEVRSLETHDFARPIVESRRAELERLEEDLRRAIADRASLVEELRAHRDSLLRPAAPPPPQAHLRTQHLPHTEEQRRRTRFLRAWAALSTPLLLASVPVILLARPLAWSTMLAVEALLFTGVEAFARRRLVSFAGSVALLLAVAAAFVAIIELSQQYWAWAISAVFAIAALVLLFGNLGDLGHGWRRGGSMGEDPREDQLAEKTGSATEDGRSGP
jgi:hypothetical protein